MKTTSENNTFLAPLAPRALCRRSVLPVLVVCASLAVGGQTATAAPLNLAIMGDYFSSLHYTSTWAYQLQAAGALAVHDDTTPYAVSDDVLNTQLPVVLQQIGLGQVSAVTIAAGAGDAISYLQNSDVTDAINAYVANMESVITAIKNANPQIQVVFANMPDITVTPAAQQYLASGNITPADAQAVRSAIMSTNAQMKTFALAHHVPIVDLFKATDVLTPMYPWTFGGHTFATMYQSDGIDILTQPQGIVANAFAIALNRGYGDNLQRLSDQQIVTNAGYIPNFATTYYDAGQFVIAPEPSTLALAMLVLPAAIGWRRRGNC